MAYPLMFVDEQGVLRRYRWRGYPTKVPKYPIASMVWGAEDIMNGPPITSATYEFVMVFCGPAAPNPARPTASEFERGVWEWLSR